jgi:hypothetical protein
MDAPSGDLVGLGGPITMEVPSPGWVLAAVVQRLAVTRAVVLVAVLTQVAAPEVVQAVVPVVIPSKVGALEVFESLSHLSELRGNRSRKRRQIMLAEKCKVSSVDK